MTPRLAAALLLLSALFPSIALAKDRAGAARRPEPIQAAPPAVAPDEKTLPYEKPVNGLACRVWMPADDFCHGQAIGLSIEIKNVSDHDLYLPDVLNPQFTQWAKLAVIGPHGKALKQGGSAQTVLQPAAFTLLRPGHVRRFDVANLRDYYYPQALEPGLGVTGNYVLTYQFTGPALPERSVIGERRDGGKVEKLFAEPSADQKKFAWAGTVKSNVVNFKIVAPRPRDLTLHEWGVFTVFNDSRFANVNRKAEWGSLPEFFYRQFPTRRLKWAPAVWDKPIVYFYTERQGMQVEMKVKFAGGGAPVAWWPCASEPVNSGMSPRGGEPRNIDRPVSGGATPKVFDTLKWDLQLGRLATTGAVFGGGQPNSWVEVAAGELPETCWLKDARLPDAALVTASGTSLEGGKPWSATRRETEGFVFYDGLVPAPDYLQCVAIGERTISLRNTSNFDMDRVFVIDRRDGKLRVSAEPLKSGDTITVEPREEKLGDILDAIRQDLTEAGLFEAEARALLKIWHQGFFENAGVVAFYLLPVDEYNRMLPLETRPATPRPPVRVGIAFHPNFDAGPAIARKIQTLIMQLDDDVFARRQSAREDLIRLGPVVIQSIQAALKKSPSPDAQQLMREILERVDASQWLGN